MLLRLEFDFVCAEHGQILGIGGGELHGLFFAMLEQACSSSSAEIHGAVVKPFAISPIVGKGVRDRGSFQLAVGEHYRFQIAAFSPEMVELLLQVSLQARPEHKFRLGSATCAWVGVRERGKTDYAKLLSGRHSNKLLVEFHSPTAFRSQGILKLFPIPSLLFPGLEERWNHFSGTDLFLSVPDESVMVSKYELKTHFIRYADYALTGFIGKAEFTFLKGIHEANSLLRFAEFAGIGYKTSMGMGNVRIKSINTL